MVNITSKKLLTKIELQLLRTETIPVNDKKYNTFFNGNFMVLLESNDELGLKS